MKYFLLTIGIVLGSLAVFCQADTIPVYKRFPTVPPFSIIRLPDSSRFSKADLARKKETIVMIFSPDCEHCQRATRDLIEHIALFKKVQIVMATPLEFRLIRPFYEEFHIGNYPNIIMGRDPAYFLGNFYQVRFFPSIFLYDKKGRLLEHFEGDVSFEKIAGFL